MARLKQACAVKGSQRWLQRLVNDAPDVLREHLAGPLGLSVGDHIEWLSPRVGDDYAEYRDESFLDRLGIELRDRPLGRFWPTRGPVWDGLAKTVRGDLLLVEAKAHIPEIVSTPCRAEGASMDLIRRSLEETCGYLHGGDGHDWTARFYQYTNRLAHLYLLRVLNGLPAWLVLFCFVGDEEVGGPETPDEWRGALALLDAYLGLRRHRLSPFVLHLMIDVREVGGGR